MMTGVFCAMLVASYIVAALTGRISEVSSATLSEAQRAIELVISLTGSFCLWGGVVRVAQKAKLTERLAKLMSPITSRLFKGLKPGGEAMNAATLNLSANLLGLGSAATPLGIAALQAMEKEQHPGDTATDDMAMFTVLNTASLQLIPTTTAMLRLAAGSQAPMEILPAVWLASTFSVLCGVLAAKSLARLWGVKWRR